MADNKIPFEKSFAFHEKAKCWSDKNKSKPENILNNKSHTKYWFYCQQCSHDFEIALSHLNEGKWCPYCNSDKLCLTDDCNYCYNKSFASNEKSKYWCSENNNNIKPRHITKSSGKSFYFNCENGHKFYQRINYIHNGKWCNICCNSKRLCSSNECEKCNKNSFMYNEKSKYWNYTLNKDVNPRDVFNSSNQKYWFDCQKCGHNFEIALCHVNEGKWCSYCNGDLLCDDTNCNYCFEKSFASEEKSKYWNSELNNNIIPRKVLKNSGRKYYFNCDNCPHSFEKVLSDITGGHWCPFCCMSSSTFCNDINCIHCFEKSFASHKKSKFWSNKNNISPNKITKGSKKSYYFNCDKCNNHFKSIIYNIVKSNSWCPKCYNKTELKLYEFIKNIFSQTIHQYKAIWCKNIDTDRYLPLDFCIEEYKIIIELDGLQHFEQVMNWKKPEEQQENDKYKEKCANENGYSIIRLLQEDVFYDKYDWKTELINNIEKIKTDNIIQNIYMCNNNEYENFKN
jgi:very-short-patch-repair endonuclease